MAAEEFTDERLSAVTQDNIHPDIYIGPQDAFDFSDREVHPESTGTTENDARRYHVLELEIELTNDSSSNYVIGRVVGDDHNVPPSEGDPLDRDVLPEVISIDVDNELMEHRPNVDGEITRLFTGIISNASRLGNEKYEFMAFWPGFNEIQEGTVDVVPPPGESNLIQGFHREVDYNVRRSTTRRLAHRVGRKVTDRMRFGYRVDLTNTGELINGTIMGQSTEITTNMLQGVSITTDNSEGILTRITEASNAVWDVDRWGTFAIGPPTPEGDDPNGVAAHKLRYIIETDAGRRSPVWRSIKVIGDGVVSTDGWNANALVNENPTVLKSNTTGREGGSLRDDALAEPTFVYKNMEINTTTEAENVLADIRDEIREQMAGGHITVVGHPEVWPGDAVELPNAPGQPFNLDRFLVKKVIHRLNRDDGFTTRIEVGGQTNAVEAIFSDEESFPSTRPYDALYDSVEYLERVERDQ